MPSELKTVRTAFVRLPALLICLVASVGFASDAALEEPLEPPLAEESAAPAPAENPKTVAPVVPPSLPLEPGPKTLKPGPASKYREETMAWRDLRLAAAREKEVWDRLKVNPGDESDKLRAIAEFRDVITAYENVIRGAPDFAEAYAAYGLLLNRTGNREEAVKAFLKANSLDADIPMVKNQLGNMCAEDGNYRQALAYYLSAIELQGDEPLYHYQLGSLLHSYDKFFIDDGMFGRPTLEEKMQTAFRRAAELAPDNWPYIYRYAESFYDCETPDWEAALAEWRRLESKAPAGLGKQTIRLHEANVLVELGRRDEAGALIATVTEPVLQEQRETVVARLLEAPEE